MKTLEYCQFLLSSQINYTLTYFAAHSQKYTHDTINRYLGRIEIKPSVLWGNLKDEIQQDAKGYLLFDDTVLDKNHSFKIEAVRRQWSGNAGRIIKGIGVVTCVYVNPTVNQFWIIDYRIYNPETDGKGKPEHVSEMPADAIEQKHLSFTTVLMDSWYASRALMLQIAKAKKQFYCPVKPNRLVCDSPEQQKNVQVSSLAWSEEEVAKGKRVHIKGFPKDFYVRLFRVELSTKPTDYVVSNDVEADLSTDDARQTCAIRWKIEQAHRELKQTTGIQECQCRKQRIQRNHIACCMLVWARLNTLAHKAGTTVYHLKKSLLDDYLCQQLRTPSIAMQ